MKTFISVVLLATYVLCERDVTEPRKIRAGSNSASSANALPNDSKVEGQSSAPETDVTQSPIYSQIQPASPVQTLPQQQTRYIYTVQPQQTPIMIQYSPAPVNYQQQLANNFQQPQQLANNFQHPQQLANNFQHQQQLANTFPHHPHHQGGIQYIQIIPRQHLPHSFVQFQPNQLYSNALQSGFGYHQNYHQPRYQIVYASQVPQNIQPSQPDVALNTNEFVPSEQQTYAKSSK